MQAHSSRPQPPNDEPDAQDGFIPSIPLGYLGHHQTSEEPTRRLRPEPISPGRKRPDHHGELADCGFKPVGGHQRSGSAIQSRARGGREACCRGVRQAPQGRKRHPQEG
ncbi:hypothetical protein PanWU01x14_024130 [Parasponia andersonii]|uniref:Uncharacterized protein n=1 Tax=Parasponia andersonii TaxID=3476 RepID=A0A2P5DWI8_PARAD|nr:hypothetical protein PanWU01x14_024130 [Parasponia andersonii]